METHHFNEEIGESGGRLKLNVEVGSVEISGGKHSSVVIDAETEWMDVDVHRDGKSVAVTIRVSEEARSLMQRAIGLMMKQQPRAEVTIMVPYGCQIDARVTTGRLSVEEIDSPVRASVTTGKLSLADLGDLIEARVVTGQIVYSGGLSPDEHRFKVTTGTLRLNLDGDAGAELDLQTLTGSVHCDQPLARRSAQRHLVGGRLRGVLGDGAARLHGRVVTGNISLGREKMNGKELRNSVSQKKPSF